MLALKLFLVPFLIGAISLAGRRWGPAIAGWLSGFPVVTGPILLFVAIEHGPVFASAAAVGALSGILANISFGIAYAWSAVRYPWWAAAPAGYVAYAGAVLLLNALVQSLYAGLAITLAGLWMAAKSFPKHVEIKLAGPTSRAELPLRMFSGAALAGAVTYFAESLGAHMSGLLSTFPVMASVLAIFTHRSAGAGASIRFLRGMVTGIYAFVMFSVSLVLALPALGTGAGFLVALIVAVLAQAASLRIASAPERLPGRRQSRAEPDR